MRHAKNTIIDWTSNNTAETAENVIGRIVDITSEGIAVVDYPDNPIGPLRARSAISEPLHGDVADYLNARVMLMFENRDPALPVVVGVVRDTLFPLPASRETPSRISRSEEVALDGTSLRLDAEEELILNCGKSAVILRKDGRVTVKGVEITNRATRSNKIKGGRVRIN